MSQLADVNTQSSVGMFHFMMSYIALSAYFVLDVYIYVLFYTGILLISQ